MPDLSKIDFQSTIALITDSENGPCFDHVPEKYSSFPGKVLPAAHLVEEERTPNYNPQHFYPVRLYEIFNSRYQIAAKIGWGTSSTVWLARDLYQISDKITNFCLTVCYAVGGGGSRPDMWPSKFKLMRTAIHLQSRNFVTTFLDSFYVASPNGTHNCMVFDVLCEPLWMLKRRFQGNIIPLDGLKPVSKLILKGLRYLHNECHVVHTGIKHSNGSNS
ncbi:uncharacterized protein N7483_001994 [Penicillium malachiteum]|uniref:uncharacterized protein n=1 Tax=Penicillium malachiteum TaxID=1324776 RepID=UPI0025483539|nr:uncharacterized protein N7483_001994 [Penicillium malachiteum]KAJ5736869.1 hypothetical protein N7483_001994 [Penicillium malachiteum]